MIEIRQLSNIAFDAFKDDMGVSGYVNEVGKLSQPLRDKKGRIFREKIEKGAFKRAIQRAEDNGRPVKLLFRHNNSDLLASTKNGSLTLEEDNVGLKFSANIVNTSLGKDVHEYVRSGLISNMSFGFIKPVEEWSFENGQNIRTLKDFDLTEISILDNPAYLDSSVKAVREISLIEDVEVPDVKGEKMKRKDEKRAYIEKAYCKEDAKRMCFDCLASLYSIYGDEGYDFSLEFDDKELNLIEQLIDVLNAKLKKLTKVNSDQEKRDDNKKNKKETAEEDDDEKKNTDAEDKDSEEEDSKKEPEDEESEDKKGKKSDKDDKTDDKTEKRNAEKTIVFSRDDLDSFIKNIEQRAYNKFKIKESL